MQMYGRQLSTTREKFKQKKMKKMYKYEIYQNQRAENGLFCDKLRPGERPNWSDLQGNSAFAPEQVELAKGWYWLQEWKIESNCGSKEENQDGWSYAKSFESKFHKERGLLDLVRRRKWVRSAATDNE